MTPPVLTLLTDFGSADHYAGAMKGVILGICPDARLVDISHQISPYSVTEAAYTLAQSWPCFPAGTVHLIVVDPGVGSSRRPLLAEAAGHFFVAPDNGVLSMIYEAIPAHEIREITASRFFRPLVSRTFHGRDIFAPVAAHVANGVPVEEFGNLIDDYLQLVLARPVQTGPKTWTGTVLHIDRFGNVVTNFSTADWPDLAKLPFQLRVSQFNVTQTASTYAAMEPGKFCLILGSSGYWELSCNQQDSGKLLALGSGDVLTLRYL